MVGNGPLIRDLKRALADSGLAVLDLYSFYLQPETDLDGFTAPLELGAELGGRYAVVMRSSRWTRRGASWRASPTLRGWDKLLRDNL